MSGKAMQVAVPPGGSALREMTRSEKSEGHGAGVCGLFVDSNEALPEPKRRSGVAKLVFVDKCMTGKGLAFC
jgi:hypothetical protein